MLLWRASLRFLTRHPAQCALAVSGIALGVAIVIGILLTQASARQAFAESLRSVFGNASHYVVAIDGDDFDESVLALIRREAPQMMPAAIVSGTLRVDSATGQRAVQVLGVDALAMRGELDARRLGWTKFLTAPGAMLMTDHGAQRLGLQGKARLTARHDDHVHTLELIATLAANDAGASRLADDVALVDIASAQECLHKVGRLTRIELDAGNDADAAATLASLAQALPGHLGIIDAGRQARGARNLTDAFYTNLDALSLLALLVGGFMIYNTMAFLVMQRQSLFARLRALGVTRAALARLVVAEALTLGLLGGVCGCGLGYALARALLAPVGQTLRDHYLTTGGGQLVFAPMLAVLGVALAAITTLLAAALPAWSALRADPAHAARYSVSADSAARGLGRAACAGLACVLLAIALLGLSSRSLYAGFAALGACILAAMLLVPWLTQRGLGLLAHRHARLRPLPLRLAVRGAARSMGRIGMAVAALMAATATSVGVGLMVASFRGAVDDWLSQLLRAEIYISPGFDEQAPPRIDERFIATVTRLPEIATVSKIRRARLLDGDGELRVTAYELPVEAQRGFQFLHGVAPWPAWSTQDVAMISEPLSWHLQKQVGDVIEIPTPRGRRAFRIAGIYSDYGSESGVVAISLARFRHYWQDERVHGIGIYPRARVDSARLEATLTRLLPNDGSLAAWSNATLKARSLAVFDRTFAITHVLTLFAAAIAALGVFNALLALHLERGREYAMLLATGLSPAALRATLYLQTAVIAVLAACLALPLGVLVAKLLIAVINIRSFGWSMQMSLDARALLMPAGGALLAALAATVYPAERAVRIDPATALRYE
jgi:putative ABC transport system permease protein